MEPIKKVYVKIIQAAINLSQSSSFALKEKLIVDGAIGKKTISAIEHYQSLIINMKKPDGRVDPGGNTIRTLKTSLTKGLSVDALIAIMGYGSPVVVKGYHPLLINQLPLHGITTPLRIAHFLATRACH
ncbi:hypothetical protein ACSV5M_00200 [Cellvibrio sp. ARAG 10.3]|uniref:hypothetical protein n=1 Tax=Cellvibrio sp. ARAG 10.3 TaxID=3451358 RepID=UPI003F46AA53